MPEKIVESALENNKKLVSMGKRMHLINGVTSQLSSEMKIEVKISDTCEKYLKVRGYITRIGETQPSMHNNTDTNRWCKFPDYI